MPAGLLQSVGRGYSDLWAAMCAVGVGARELQLWKEVDGIFTADLSKVPSARLLAMVTSEEAVELTYFGSEISNFHLFLGVPSASRLLSSFHLWSADVA